MAVNLSLLGGAGAQFFNNNGRPLSGGKLYTYAAGTTTPLATYTDSTGGTQRSNPIMLDAAGRIPDTGELWITLGSYYKFALFTSADVPVADWDNVGELDYAASGGSALIGFIQAGTGAVLRTAQSKMREWVSVKDFGAVGDGVADDTAEIQAAVNHCAATGLCLLIPPGTYMVNAVGSGATPNTNGGIVINDPITIFMYGAKLKAITNASSSYVVLNIRNANNVFVFGGEVEGERYTHTGVGGEQGHGIVITGSEDVRLQDIYVSDCWGDCVGVRTDGNAVNRRITLDNVTCDAARRNGLTVQLVDGFLAQGCRFINTSGTAPQSGVDLEPNPAEGASKNCIFQGCYFAANSTSDFVGGGGDGIENVLISNCTFADTIASGLIISGATLCNKVEVSNNVMSMRAASSIGVQIGSSTGVKVLDNVITRAGTYSADSSAGLYADGTSTNLVFRGNQLSGFRQGIQIQTATVTYVTIENNEVSGCARAILGGATITKAVIRNNAFRNLLANALQFGFADVIISGNLFEDIATRGSNIGGTNGFIANNTFNRVGTNDQANEPCLSFSIAADNCTVVNNAFYSVTAAQDAIRASVAPTTPSFFSGNVARYGAQTDVFVLNASHIVGENFANTASSGSFTLSAAATRVVTNNNVTAASKILLTPTNAAAATLMSGAKSLYVSAKTAGTSFTVATADGTAAGGTETFDYEIVS